MHSHDALGPISGFGESGLALRRFRSGGARGAFFGVWMLQIYGAERQIVTNIALASLTFVLIGFFLLSTSITLCAIARLAQRTDEKR